MDIKNDPKDSPNCFSLKSPHINKEWQEFLNDLSRKKYEISFSPKSQLCKKTFCDKKPRTDFRKTMKNGPGFDMFGQIPISQEELRIYRSPAKPIKSISRTVG